MIGKRITATGDASTGPSLLRGLIVFPGAAPTAPRLTLTNDTSGGLSLFDLSLPADVSAGGMIALPGNGIRFPDGIHVATLTDIDAVTLLIGTDGA